MNIVQLNQYIEKIARCVQIVHSYSSQSPYEYWNAKGDVQYGSVCFCIKKSRMRSNTITYDAVLYYGDRVYDFVDMPSNKEQIWSDANNVIQNIVGTINMQSGGDVSVSYPYDITNFEQKFADNLAGAYATLSIETRGIGECGDLLYGYEAPQEGEIKLESIVKTITINGEYDIVSSKDYDAISDVKVIVNVAPDPMETFASIGYNEENAGGFLQQFNTDLDVAKMILDNWNSTGNSAVNMDLWKNITTYFPAVDLTMKPDNMYFAFDSWPKLQVVPALDFTGKTSMYKLFAKSSLLMYVGKITGTRNVTNMDNIFDGCNSLISVDVSEMDTSNATKFHSLFANCYNLTSIDLSHWDTSNVTDFYQLFYYCRSLNNIKVSTWNTSNVKTMTNAFFLCDKLTSLDISNWDFSNVTNIDSFIGGYSDNTYLTNLKFGKNLKINWTSYGSPYRLPNLTVESLLSIIDGLYDFTGNGETPTSSQGTCQFGTTNLNKLTADQIAVAANKGWTLT